MVSTGHWLCWLSLAMAWAAHVLIRILAGLSVVRSCLRLAGQVLGWQLAGLAMGWAGNGLAM
jgi:hypothetical protein